MSLKYEIRNQIGNSNLIKTFEMSLTFISSRTKLLFISLAVVSFSCQNVRSKAKHYNTAKVCKGKLFVETYEISGNGAFGGDKVSEYLTDSVNFRMYVGTFDNSDEAYSFLCTGDSVEVYRVAIRSNIQNKIVRKQSYSLSGLQAKKIFE